MSDQPIGDDDDVPDPPKEKPRRKGGRPRKQERTTTASTRITEKDFDALVRLAIRTRTSIASLIRQFIKKQLATDKS